MGSPNHSNTSIIVDDGKTKLLLDCGYSESEKLKIILNDSDLSGIVFIPEDGDEI